MIQLPTMRRGTRPHSVLATIALLGFVLAGVAGGCQTRSRPQPPAAAAGDATAVVTAPTPPPTGPAELPLDQIEPVPTLGNPRPPAAGPARPPGQALLLYAKARDAAADGRRADAVLLLQEAAALDPGSYLLHYELGKAYKAGMSYDLRSIAEMEAATAIEPDHLDAQLDLGRQYLSRGDAARGLLRLRLARLTRQYKAGDPRALEVDLFLAHALQGQGYDRAALATFEQVLKRLADRGGPRGMAHDTASQVAGRLQQEVGDLYLKRGDPERALAAYRLAAGAGGDDPEDFELQARMVRALMASGRMQEAATRAANLVARSRASADSVVLLREVYRAVGRENDAATELAHLHEEKPGDRAILFALADVLRTDGKWAEADKLLAKAADLAPNDAEVVRRRFGLYETAGDLDGAARLLIEATARRPDLAGELTESWNRLLRTENRDRLTPDGLGRLAVAPGAEAARAYAVNRAAASWPRRALAKAVLAEALKARPAFPPAYRQRLDDIWDDDGLSADSKAKAGEELAAAADHADNAALAAEIRGRSLTRQGDAAGGAAALAEAIKLDGSVPLPTSPGPDAATTGSGSAGAVFASADPGPTLPAATAATTGVDPGRQAAPTSRPTTRPATPGVPPDLHLAFAQSLLAFDNVPSFERLMWKLIADHPAYGAAYDTLLDFYRGRGAADSAEKAEKVLAAWHRAEPLGLASRLAQARDALRQGRLEAAEVLLDGLFAEFGDDADVLSLLGQLYAQTGRTDQLLARLEDRLQRQPKSFNAAGWLARAYTKAGRLDAAARVLDVTRAAAAGEPDVLYDLSALYGLAQQKPVAEDVLQQVLKLDPRHPSASNDLGYAWADQGKNLDRAEALARAAADQSPENPTYLDSLGWVLYKRGRFDEARQVLERAVGPANTPSPATQPADRSDPVVLDHMGDVLYRLNDRDAAGRFWERSRRRLAGLGAAAGDREDLRPLGLRLEQKAKQLKTGQPVSVAPVAEEAPPVTRPVQAGPIPR